MTNTFDFSAALTLLKEGKFVRRQPWPDAFLMLAGQPDTPVGSIKHDGLRRAVVVNLNPGVHVVSHINMYFGRQSRMISGWTPNTVDLQASDWVIYDPLPTAIQTTGVLLKEALEADDLNATSWAAVIEQVCYMLSLPVENRITLESGNIEFTLGGKFAGVRIMIHDGSYTVSVETMDDGKQVFSYADGEGNLMSEIEKAMTDAGIKPSTRKFYSTLVELTVLSEEPIPEGLEVDEIVRRANDADYVGAAAKMTATELTATEVVDALYAAGSQPEFFNLTPEGRDAE